MATNLKHIAKALLGGENLTLGQRAIFIWWVVSLFACVVFVEAFPLLILSAANFVLASKHMQELPPPDMNEEA